MGAPRLQIKAYRRQGAHEDAALAGPLLAAPRLPFPFHEGLDDQVSLQARLDLSVAGAQEDGQALTIRRHLLDGDSFRGRVQDQTNLIRLEGSGVTN